MAILQTMDLVQNELFTENPINKFFICEEIGKKHTTVEVDHQTVCTTCGLVMYEDTLIATPNKDNLNPEIPIKHPKILGSLILKRDLENKPKPYKDNLKEILQRLKEAGVFSVWTPERIDQVFDNFVIELNGKVPTYRQFQKKYPGALDAIHKGRYNPKIRKWSEYAESRGRNTYVNFLTTKDVDEAFMNLVKEFTRFPKSTEFQYRFSGPYKMILEGRYSPKISSWKEFVKLMTLYQLFYNLEEKLDRIPTYREFKNQFYRIKTLNPKIKSFNDLLEYLGREPRKANGYWTPENIEKVYQELEKSLNKTLTRDEFKREYGGACRAIERGKYNPNITSYRDFVDAMKKKTHSYDTSSDIMVDPHEIILIHSHKK